MLLDTNPNVKCCLEAAAVFSRDLLFIANSAGRGPVRQVVRGRVSAVDFSVTHFPVVSIPCIALTMSCQRDDRQVYLSRGSKAALENSSRWHGDLEHSLCTRQPAETFLRGVAMASLALR